MAITFSDVATARGLALFARWVARSPRQNALSIWWWECVTRGAWSVIKDTKTDFKQIEIEKNRHVSGIVTNENLTKSSVRERLDFEQVRSAMAADPEKLVTHLLGEKPTSRTASEVRYGKKGSFSLSIKSCDYSSIRWTDFESGEGGRLTDLIKRELNCPEYKDQMREAASFYGIVPTPMSLERVSAEKVDRTIADQKERQKKTDHVIKTFKDSRPIAGTIAESYLTNHRKIETSSNVPTDSLRFIESHSRNKLPGLVAFARNKDGKVTAMQITYLDPNSANGKAQIDVPKRSHGALSGSVVEIKAGAAKGVLFAAEGVETALSIAGSVPKDARVVAVLGVSNFKNIHAIKDQRIIICADNDGANAPATQTIAKAAKKLESQGAIVEVIHPKEMKYDFNDVLRKNGPVAVKDYMDQALRNSAERQKFEVLLGKLDNTTVYGRDREIREILKDMASTNMKGAIAEAETMIKELKPHQITDSAQKLDSLISHLEKVPTYGRDTIVRDSLMSIAEKDHGKAILLAEDMLKEAMRDAKTPSRSNESDPGRAKDVAKQEPVKAKEFER